MDTLTPASPELEQIATQVVDAAYQLHKCVGPGLLEGVYEAFFCHELSLRNLKVDRQVALPLTYKGKTLEGGLRIDLIVGDLLLVELKAVETLLPLHQKF